MWTGASSTCNPNRVQCYCHPVPDHDVTDNEVHKLRSRLLELCSCLLLPVGCTFLHVADDIACMQITSAYNRYCMLYRITRALFIQLLTQKVFGTQLEKIMQTMVMFLINHSDTDNQNNNINNTIVILLLIKYSYL